MSNDFVQALKLIPSAMVAAVSARSLESAQKFAERHGVSKYYGSYEEMLTDDEIEIVYVGNVHSYRRSIGEKCLLANKHVLLEKPFACNATDAEYLISLAKEKKLFIMEGMWTRFFPAVEKARRLVLGDKNNGQPGVIGEVVSVISDFNFNASDNVGDPYPTSIFYNHKEGGGASLFVAPYGYPIATATMFLMVLSRIRWLL